MLGGITGEELEAYAAANGLRIMSHRSAYDWAKTLNRNNGLCPCGKVCPCEDCTCKFYEIGNEEEQMVMIQNEEIAGAVETLENTKELLLSLSDEGVTKEEAMKKLEEAETMILKDAEKHECGECAKYMEGFARKISFLKSECEKDPVACSLERNDTLNRIDTMQQTFIGVDKEVSKAESEATGEKTENAETVLKPEVDEAIKPYRDCVRDTMAELTEEEPNRQTRLCMSTKMCGKNEPKTKETAIAECVKSKEEKENGQNSS